MTTTGTASQPDAAQQAAEATAALVALHMVAESHLLDQLTLILRRAGSVLTALPRIRAVVRTTVGTLEARTPPLVDAVVTAELAAGDEAATSSVLAAIESLPAADRQRPDVQQVEVAAHAAGSGGGAVPPDEPPVGAPHDQPSSGFDLSVPHGVRSEAAIRADLVSELDDVRRRITRLPDDVYKEVVARAAQMQVLGVELTPEQAQAIAWREFTANGVTGFTDKSGRDWSLSAYVEMAVRTAAARAFNASHLERMHALGVHYFTVSDDGSPCPYCFPWQNAVLTDGPIGDPEMHVDATIAEATAAKLFHPNCRHTLVAVFPGITKLPPRQQWTKAQDTRYRAVQKQRRLELAVRKAKRQVENALTPDAGTEARQTVRKAQQRLRDHVKAHDFLARQSRREQPHLRDASTKVPILR
jgi:hypothetical protein